MAQEKMDKIKSWFGDSKKKFDDRMTMAGILKQARESFEHFLSQGNMVNVERRISDKLWRDAWGIVFLSEVKAGFGIGGKAGTGIIITRIEKQGNEWSAPMAVGTGGLSVGFQFGASKVDHIIILPSPNHVKAFLGQGQLHIKGNAEAVVLDVGRDANVGVGVSNKGDAAPIMSYSFGVKGLYGGVSIDGAVLVPRKQCNDAFYGESIEFDQLTSGSIPRPTDNEDYATIIKLLDINSAVTGGPLNIEEDDLQPLSKSIDNDKEENEDEDDNPGAAIEHYEPPLADV